MENVMTIKAESRAEIGKKISKQLRREGRIPAIIYGGQQESIPISLDIDDIMRILKSEKGENTVLRIQRDTVNVDAMLQEIQYDYSSDNVIHVDLMRIDIDKPVTVNVPIVIKGEPIGVKVEDGTFDFITREVRLRCLVTKIPTEIDVDVSQLHAGHSIKAGDLEIDQDIHLVSDSQTVICSVSTRGKLEAAEEIVEKEEAEAAAKEAEEEQADSGA